MRGIFNILVYALIGLLTSSVYFNVIFWQKNVKIRNYLLISIISAVCWGLIAQIILGFRFIDVNIEHFSQRNQTSYGDISVNNFNNTELWVASAAAFLGAILMMIFYRFISKSRLDKEQQIN